MDYNSIKVNKKLKIVYMGTPEFSEVVLRGLLEKYSVRAIVTQPDKEKDRDKEIVFSPVKKLAIEKTVLVLQPENIKKEYDEILALDPDIIITCAYGQIIPKEVLEYPRYGCINVHASLLPKLRGGAPIHRAIINGHKETGITIMYMDQDMDAGDIISQKKVEITDTDTAESLHDKLAVLGRDFLFEVLPSILDGTNNRTKQEISEVTFGLTIKREDEKIDFEKTKRQIYNQVRGLYSWPGAYCLYEGKILKIWKCYHTDVVHSNLFNGQISNVYPDGFAVKVNNGEVVFTEVQLEGKQKMSALDFLNGVQNKDNIIGKILD